MDRGTGEVIATAAELSSLFLGREGELRFLEGLLDEVAVGRTSRGLLLTGTPGQGKSTLLRHLQEQCDRMSFRTTVLRSPGEGLSNPNFPIMDLLKDLKVSFDDRATALPTLADLTRALNSVVSDPLAILIDDAQWIPPESLDTLVSAVRLRKSPSLLALAVRRTSQKDLIPHLQPSGDLWVHFLELDGLDRSSTGLLAEALLGGPVLPSLITSLHSWTRGNPLFVRELIREWRTQGALSRVGAYWTSDRESFGPPSPSSLSETLALRLSRLEEANLRLVQIMTLMGRPVELGELLAMGLSSGDLLPRLEELIQEGFLREASKDAPTYDLAHPLFGTAALASASATRRAILHETILLGLLDRQRGGLTVPASELATHAIYAPQNAGDIELLVHAAAEEAESSGVFSKAAKWYGWLRTIAQARGDDPRSALEKEASATSQFDPRRSYHLYSTLLETAASDSLLLGRARSRRRMGDFEGAMGDLMRALTHATPQTAFAIRHEVAALHGILGNLGAAEKLLRELVAESQSTSHHSKAIGHLAQVQYCSGEIASAHELASVALEQADDPDYRLFLKDNLSWYALALGRWGEATWRLEQGLEEANRAGNLWSLVNLLGNSARLKAWTGEIAEAFDYASRGQGVAYQLPNGAEQWSATEALAMAHLESGNPRSALACLSEVMSQEAPVDFPERCRTYVLMAELLITLGRISDASDFVTESRQHVAAARCFQVSVDRAAAQVYLARGSVEAAIETLHPWLQQSSPLLFEQALLLETAAHVFLLAGQRSNALTVAQRAWEIHDQLGAVKHSAEMASWIAENRPRPRGRPSSQMPWGLTSRELDVLRLLIAGRTDPEIAKVLFLGLGTVKKHVENIKSKVGLRRRVELVGLASALDLESYLANPQNPM